MLTGGILNDHRTVCSVRVYRSCRCRRRAQLAMRSGACRRLASASTNGDNTSTPSTSDSTIHTHSNIHIVATVRNKRIHTMYSLYMYPQDKRKATPAERYSGGVTTRPAKSTRARLIKTKHLNARALNAPEQDAVRNSHKPHPVTVHRGCALEFAGLPTLCRAGAAKFDPLEASRVRC
jgi:hypothetical protein